jgi:hypothetical protein
MPAGSRVIMNKESAYMNSKHIFNLAERTLSSTKTVRQGLVEKDGHASHCNKFEMLDFTRSNYIVLLCLASHTTEYLQSIDRTFFKPLKESITTENAILGLRLTNGANSPNCSLVFY